jgi:NAD(P)-dependent dehydrogenase (short-subunit alcohol dehydrogenase family)
MPEPSSEQSAGPGGPTATDASSSAPTGGSVTGSVINGLWKAPRECNNLNGTANTIRAFAPKMVARRKGRIIALSSMQGKHGTKDAASYSASKWRILGLMKSAALELGQYNITVNAVIPGLVDTPLTRYEKRLSESIAETGQKAANPTPQQAWDIRAAATPMTSRPPPSF